MSLFVKDELDELPSNRQMVPEDILLEFSRSQESWNTHILKVKSAHSQENLVLGLGIMRIVVTPDHMELLEVDISIYTFSNFCNITIVSLSFGGSNRGKKFL